MRIDRFLHCIRLARSRTLAQTIIADGHVRISGRRVAKPTAEVRPGDVVALPLNRRIVVLRVLDLPRRRGPASEARCCCEEVGVDEPPARS